MTRNILLRFEANNELILLIDKVAKKLGNTNSGVTKLALWEFVNRVLNKDGNTTTK